VTAGRSHGEPRNTGLRAIGTKGPRDEGTKGSRDEENEEAGEGCKIYPAEFTKERPMRALFLGQVNVRKGVIELLEAARMLKDEPIEFLVVGGVTDGLLLEDVPGKVRLVEAVERGEAERWYGEADVLCCQHIRMDLP
jgi:glycosyltransferase involved in cell wall biosynthesis